MKAISGKEFRRVIEQKGWKLSRIRGSHHRFNSPDGKKAVVIPIHGSSDIPRGLLHALMKSCNLSEDDF